MNSVSYDVVVVGAGAAGVSAALAAAQSGLRTGLLEAGSFVGGELVSGLPIDSCVNARGEWIVGGIPRQLFAAAEELGGYIGPVFDWRTMYAVCLDPELFRVAIIGALKAAGVDLQLYTTVYDVGADGGRVKAALALVRGQPTMVSAKVFIDCSGDGVLASLAGAPFEIGDSDGTLQPVSLVFRIGDVDYSQYMEFLRDHPSEFTLAENPVIGKSASECALAAHEIGLPHVALSSEGSVLGSAISSGEMYPCTFVFTWPTSFARREVGLNTTRLAGVDATKGVELSGALSTLSEQVMTCMDFCARHLPGFEDSHLAAIAPRVGVRETRRIMGESVLTGPEVIAGRKQDDGIAKGSHHIDLHGSGTAQTRIPVQGGGSYDVPFGALIPRGLGNVLVAGRCISTTREANGSARVMGVCLGTGQAAGIAATMLCEGNLADTREVPVAELRDRLRGIGAVLDGTA